MINIKSSENSIKLLTKDKFCNDDINVTFEGGSSDTTQEDGLLDGTLTTYTNDRVTRLIPNAFYAQQNLENVDLPNVQTIYHSAFYGCSTLKTVRLANANSIAGYTFAQCSALRHIYLGYDGIVTLENISAFPTPSGTGLEEDALKVHVRPEYVEQYKNATNWSSVISNWTILLVGDYSD